jgi:hypothetical protein
MINYVNETVADFSIKYSRNQFCGHCYNSAVPIMVPAPVPFPVPFPVLYGTLKMNYALQGIGLQNLDEAYLEKITEFLNHFVSAHLR